MKISTELYETTYLMMDSNDRGRVRKIVKEVEKLEEEIKKLKFKNHGRRFNTADR